MARNIFSSLGRDRKAPVKFLQPGDQFAYRGEYVTITQIEIFEQYIHVVTQQRVLNFGSQSKVFVRYQ